MQRRVTQSLESTYSINLPLGRAGVSCSLSRHDSDLFLRAARSGPRARSGPWLRSSPLSSWGSPPRRSRLVAITLTGPEASRGVRTRTPRITEVDSELDACVCPTRQHADQPHVQRDRRAAAGRRRCRRSLPPDAKRNAARGSSTAKSLVLPHRLIRRAGAEPVGVPPPLRSAGGEVQLPHLVYHRHRLFSQSLGLTGAGVTVAVIDSGIATWHDDLTNNSCDAVSVWQPARRQVRRLRQRPTHAYDDYGHGTHVAGIIAGNGYDSNGAEGRHRARRRAWSSLKVLDATGNGRSATSSRRSTGCWRITPPTTSASSTCRSAPAIHESCLDRSADPRRQARRRRRRRRRGCGRQLRQNAPGLPQYGGISAPGNAPWVLTVGALEHAGHASAVRRHVGELQLARSDVSSTGPRSPTWSRPASAWCRWHRPAARSI